MVGVVETHGRAETEAQLAGLEIIPRKHVEYKGQVLEEMDLDAILARRPQLVLVDELAHTNAPGSRHPKRYLDVEELLAAGIDVYSTMNVQHVESLNDIVARITRIRVRETVPDSVVDSADEVELVDLTPADLIARLGEGKVYVREQAQRAREALLLARQPDGAARAGAAPHRRARRRADAELHARARHHRPVGRRRAGDRVCRSRSRCGQHRARRQAHRRRPRCRADRALRRDRAPFAVVGARADEARRGPAAGRAAGRRGRAGARPVRGRGDPGLCPLAQCHAGRGRQVAAIALVRAPSRFGGRRRWCAAARGWPSRWRRRATSPSPGSRSTGCSTRRAPSVPISKAS